uniref:RRM domain-containing protein n=1 Tax=Oryza glumipatula TaxID=40148 RepID=A0A0D9ZPS5_9ORYZ
MTGARAAVIPVAAPPRTISVSLAASPSSSHPLRPVASSASAVSPPPPPPPPPLATTRRRAPPMAPLLGCLSFRTTEESLRNAFERFGQLTEVNLVMERVAKRPRGFAFLSYASEEESKNAMEGMQGKPLTSERSRNGSEITNTRRGKWKHRIFELYMARQEPRPLPVLWSTSAVSICLL